MTERLFILKAMAQAAGFCIWMAVLGCISPRLMLRHGVRFERTTDGFKVTYENVRSGV